MPDDVKPPPPEDIECILNALPANYLILTPALVIAAVSDAYLRATMTERAKITGKHLFEVFPDNPNDPTASGVANLRASLERVLRGEHADTMAIQKYDVRRPSGEFEERYWSPVNTPVFDRDGKIIYIIHAVEDVTEQLRDRRRIRELSAPVVTVRDRVLLLPMIGNVDSQRAEQMMEIVLERVVAQSARVLIIDIAGVPSIDTAFGGSLVSVALAVRLLGATTILTGLGPAAAKTIVHLGLDLAALQTCGQLTEGIDVALELVRAGPGARAAS